MIYRHTHWCLNEHMKIPHYWKLIGAIGISEFAGVVGTLFVSSSLSGWYGTIQRPALNPPAWIFGPVWTTLYALMGIAAFLVWKSKNSHKKLALSLFGLQLAVNSVWSIIFFGLRNPGLAFVDIVLLWLLIIGTMVEFKKFSKAAVYLLIPYLAWVTFASYLNYAIWVLNK